MTIIICRLFEHYKTLQVFIMGYNASWTWEKMLPKKVQEVWQELRRQDWWEEETVKYSIIILFFHIQILCFSTFSGLDTGLNPSLGQAWYCSVSYL